MLNEQIRAEIAKYVEAEYVANRLSPVIMDGEDCAVCDDVTPYSIPIPQRGETFSQMVMRLITKKGMKNSEVYGNVFMTRQVFHSMKSNENYQPTKNTAILFAIALKLSLDEAKDLLLRAGYTFSPGILSDMVVSACLTHHIYDTVEINIMLDDYGCNPLC